MVVSSNIKQQFIKDFQMKIIQGRKLLQTANHRWADKLFTDLYFDIEKKEWLDVQKKKQFTLIISNSWWMYINSLSKGESVEGKQVDFIRYLDAYNRFFAFLSKLDDFYLFNNFGTILLRSFIQKENLSQKGITKFINAFSTKLKERNQFLRLIELQILLMYLRKSVFPSDLFQLSMERLGKTILKIEPGKRALFLYILIENININFQLMEDSAEFVQIIQKLLSNRVSTYLKGVFSNLGKIIINSRNFPMILADLEDLIYYMNYIGESSWNIIIIRNLYTKFQEFQSFGDAINYIRKFIDFSISRNQFEIAYEIYDFLEDLFMYQTDLGYDNILIELWVQACKRFSDMKEKKYLLLSLEKLSTHLKTPQKSAQIFHYFYTSNYLWKFKGNFFTLDKSEFWRMIFYRVLFEEKDFRLCQKIVQYLDKNIRTQITDLNALYNVGESLKKEIYGFEDDRSDEFDIIKDPNLIIKQIVIRIDFEGNISYRMISSNNNIIEGKIKDERWNDDQILEIYSDIFSNREVKEYDLDLVEFGKLFHAFLPKTLRILVKSFKVASLNIIPQIYFIFDKMTIPFELIFDNNNFFLLKFSTAYKIGEPPIGGIVFDQFLQEDLLVPQSKDLYNVLIIDAINSKGPLRWNEDIKNKELIFPFPEGIDEFNYIMNFFNDRQEINQINVLSGPNSTRENILLNLREGAYHIIHFVGNIFYSKNSPKDSFFLTNDNNIVTFSELKNAFQVNQSKLSPFLFFNTQIYDINGNRLENVIKIFGEIVNQFEYDSITGIIARNYPLFNNETKQIIGNFYINLFNKRSQGVALLKSRQQCVAKKTANIASQQGNQINGMSLESSLAISSFILFGKPWKKIINE